MMATTKKEYRHEIHNLQDEIEKLEDCIAAMQHDIECATEILGVMQRSMNDLSHDNTEYRAWSNVLREIEMCCLSAINKLNEFTEIPF